MTFAKIFQTLNQTKGWSWKKTGLWVGAIGAIARVASSLCGRAFGMAILPGSKDAIELVAIGNRSALSWDFFLVLGIPIGGFISAARHVFVVEHLRRRHLKLAGGGFILGASASLAAGCTVGHGLTGIPLLSLGSIAFTVFAILGAWAGVIMEKVSCQKNHPSLIG